MPEEPFDPAEALRHIRTFAKVALENEEPTMRAYELVLREILKAAEKAIPRKAKLPTSPKPR